MNPISPNNSPDYAALMQMASAAQIDEQVRSFLCEIAAPSNLSALLLVCTNVRDALAGARSAWGTSPEISALDSWDEPLDWLLSASIGNALRAQSSRALATFTDDRHPLWGWGLQKYPVYAALCNSANVNAAEYRLLQAHLMLANARLMRRHAPVAIFEAYEGEDEILSAYARSNSAAFAVRLISLKPAHLPTLATSKPPQEFAQHCRSLGLGSIGRITVDVTWGRNTTSHIFDAIDLAVFLEKALGKREQWTSESSSHYGPGDRLWVSGGVSDFSFLVLRSDYDIHDDSPQGKVHASRKRFSVTKELADTLLAADDDPLEDEDGEEIDGTNLGNLGKGEEPGDYQEVSTSWANHVEMANQQFPWTFGNLVPEELHELLVLNRNELLSKVAKGELTRDERLELEVLGLIHVIFWTGSTLEKAAKLRVVETFSKYQNDELLLKLGTETECAWWRIKAPLPDYKQEQADPEQGVDRDRSSYLELPDIGDCSELISALQHLRRLDIAHAKPGATLDPTRVFTPRAHRGAVNWMIAKRGCDSRVTPDRLAKCMVQRMLQVSKGDYSATAIATGNDLNLATVRLFYACRSARRLQRQYLKAALTLFKGLHGTLPSERKQRPKLHLARPDLYIGNRRCPTLESLRNAIDHLISEIRACEERNRKNDVVDHHNWFTLYTIWFFSYTTGIRGIKTPYLPISKVDRESGIATITDKDSGFGYRTKLAWLSPDLIEQMDFYRDFVSRSLRIPQQDWPCFLIDQKMRPIQVQPATLAPEMHKFLSFPVNIHRRVVSSELLDRGCPSEVVSAWMGHWHRGEEPWAGCSSFSFAEYRRCLEKYLVPLLSDDIGFRVVRSY